MKLRIENGRLETIIIERIEATPSLLGFLPGNELGDVVRAVVTAQHNDLDEHALAVIHPGAYALIGVMTLDPFQSSPTGLEIKVRLRWRGATRGAFSHGVVKRKITVRDVRDLQRAGDRRRARLVPS